MVKIRLTRVGSKNQPKYRIVVADEQRARNGRFLEVIGVYNPQVKPAEIEVNKERLDYWVSVGAQTTSAVTNLLNT